jgi:hypothetical protein
MPRPTAEQYRAAARRKALQSRHALDFDENPPVIQLDEGVSGAFVLGWVFISDEEVNG